MRRTKSGDPTKAVGYIRVSTEKQELGPEAQRAAIESWAKSHGVELVAVHADTASGAAPIEKRPGLLAAVAELTDRGAGTLLVLRRDRIARDVVLAAMIERLVERAGARVQSTDGVASDTTPEGKLMSTLVDAFAEYERQLIRARTKSALQVKRNRGERVGSVPLGFNVDADGCHLIENPAERAAVDRVRELRAAGLSLRKIVERMNETRPVRGAQCWHLTQVARLCRA